MSNLPDHFYNHEESLIKKETGKAILYRVKRNLDGDANQPTFTIHQINHFPSTLAKPLIMLVDLGFRSAMVLSKLLAPQEAWVQAPRWYGIYFLDAFLDALIYCCSCLFCKTMCISKSKPIMVGLKIPTPDKGTGLRLSCVGSCALT